jgi:hypothetical protein
MKDYIIQLSKTYHECLESIDFFGLDGEESDSLLEQAETAKNAGLMHIAENPDYKGLRVLFN